MEKILFLTGRLAQKALERVLLNIEPTNFSWEIKQIGLQVAGLMTADMIRRRLKEPLDDFDRIVVPGRCRGDLDMLSIDLGIKVIRGPEELKDIPRFFNREGPKMNISNYDISIFAEIVDASKLSIVDILDKAEQFKRSGANVIDIGCLPETEFGHLEESITELKNKGFKVSVDSLDPNELIRASNAGADFLLSLTPETLWVINEVSSTPVLIPSQPSDEESLINSIEHFIKIDRDFYADAILDPIPFGLVNSLCRYQRLRKLFPEIKLMVGVGNVSELTEADTIGINTVLIGICSELRANAVLTTHVSDHARRSVNEIDLARRVMFAARENHSLPKGFSDDLLTIHGKKPFLDSYSEIKSTAENVKDPNFRIQISNDGIHVYNRDGLLTEKDPFAFFPNLKLDDDSSHAFYMGVELARAEIAWRLGKRYSQDRGLSWGVAADDPGEDMLTHCQPNATLKRRKGKKNDL
ncbi:MAG: dihydropteroate synthase [Betaproteobacteria bacterium TMED156]|nr:MAG: dihydropteroate synthase [Betaproteobacteria bacterium TMED156]